MDVIYCRVYHSYAVCITKRIVFVLCTCVLFTRYIAITQPVVNNVHFTTMHMYKLCTVFIIHCVSYTVFIIHVCVCDTRHCVQLLTTQGPGSTTARVSPLSPRWKSYFATSPNILHSLALNQMQILKFSKY